MRFDAFLNKTYTSAESSVNSLSVAWNLIFHIFLLNNKPISSILMSLTKPFNSFMAKKNNKSRTSSTIDELAIIKAAAWAWYHHGSGSERKPMGDFDITRIQRLPKPSRYRLEAMKVTEEDHNTRESSSQTSSPINIDNNSLLDSYEIQSISKRLEELIIDYHDHRKKVPSNNGDNTSGIIIKKKSNKLRGFWHPVLCSSKREDIAVVDTRFLGTNRRPENRRVADVKKATCRPRVTHA